MMLLALVIRNDRITLGVFRKGALIARAEMGTDKRKTADEYSVLFKDILQIKGISSFDFEGAICASVVPTLTETLKTAIKQLLDLRMHVIGSGIKTGLTIATENPAELGADLVASAVGALSKHPLPAILVDCGTAITFSYLDKAGRFLGCAIAPGISLSAKALSEAAGLLPDVSQAAPKSVIGKNTVESLRAGSLLGTASMIEGMLSRMEAEQGNAAAIISGRDAETLLPYFARPMIKDDTLALTGLALIYEKNKKTHK